MSEETRPERRLLDAGRATPDVLNGIGFAHLQLGRADQAAAMFERSLAIKADQPQIRRLLSDIRKVRPPASDSR